MRYSHEPPAESEQDPQFRPLLQPETDVVQQAFLATVHLPAGLIVLPPRLVPFGFEAAYLPLAFELLGKVCVDYVAEAVPREGLLLALPLVLQEGVELVVPELLLVSRVGLQLIDALDVYLGERV